MFKTLKSLMKDESGATVTEYAIVLGLVVLGAVTILGTLGGTIQETITRFNTALSAKLT